MKVSIFMMVCGVLFGTSISMSSFAESKWAGYTGVDTSRPQHRPPQSQRPPTQQSRPPQPQRPPQGNQNRPYVQSGINFQYTAPSYTTINQQSYSWVNGDPQVAHIESSTHQVITDWNRVGLPAPPSGNYWIYENGRYVLVPNR